MSRAAGKLADHRWSPALGRAVVALYSRMYRVALEECEECGGYESFDAFFTRRLRAGVRPISSDPGVVVSPADGRVDSMGHVDETRTFTVKGRPYRVEELVGDEREAKRYVGGAGCVIYLSPRDYHRVHSPIDGIVRHVRSLPGDYYPVNPIGVEHVPRLFVRNRRVAIAIDAVDRGPQAGTPGRGLGRVTLVMVSAMIVGRITVEGIDAWDVPLGDHALDRPVARGEELGMFHLGSTVVMLLEKSAAGQWLASEGPILLGAPLAKAAVEASTNGEHARRSHERPRGHG
jgi:phosphatidylserine decarboxylase